MSWEQRTRELMAQENNGTRVDIFGIFLANTCQDVKEAEELHAENEGEKRMK
jgi:hypothetical protein